MSLELINSEDENVQNTTQNEAMEKTTTTQMMINVDKSRTCVSNKSTKFDKAARRIKVGTRFRLCSEEKEDLFGFK